MKKEKWIITVGGMYGSFEFIGTEAEAEAKRREKARWEGAVAVKRRLTKRALDGAKVCRVIEHFYIDGVCAECGSPKPPRK